MGIDNQGQGQLTLAQNQYAFIQDVTKGPVQVYGGPHSGALSQTDRPVVFNPATGAYDPVSVSQAIKQNPLVPEGYYIVLENPAVKADGALNFPVKSSNNSVDLQVGRKIVISGPTSFALWPGQNATVIAGHKLRSNQYLIVRVYNADQANENPIDTSVSEDIQEKAKLVNGQLFVIKGTEVSFFIPESGYEVIQQDGSYVQEALTLERLEYAILLDEDGNKRYPKGPEVVFPRATEKFVRKGSGEGQSSLKFKAIELNDQMGLYIKVIADYEESGKKHVAGDELFITGKDQRIYYPRPEHSLIEYKDPDSSFNRQKYYAIAIPKGEGRYVLDKNKGEITSVKGPQMFLPDPRNETIVRRVLNDDTVSLWYPKNIEAAKFNEVLRSVSAGSGYAEASYSLMASADANVRSMNRMASGNKSPGAAVTARDEGNDRIVRGGTYTPPPMITLNTKYEGIPSIEVWTGYAVQIVSKSGERRVLLGPTTHLLDYDEKLEVLTLSTGKPKTTDTLKRDVYLRYENNLVSDVVNVVTKDNVDMSLKVSYRVNFLTEHKAKWFNVENYVKFLTDHTRSLIKAAVKLHDIKDVNDRAAIIVRDAILGKKEADKPRQREFTENGMVITEVEVLKLEVTDVKVANLLKLSQQQTVETTILLAAEEQKLSLTKRQLEIKANVAQLHSDLVLGDEKLRQAEAEAKATTQELQQDIIATERAAGLKLQLDSSKILAEVAAIELAKNKETRNFELEVQDKEVQFYERRAAAVTPQLIEAMMTLGTTTMATELAKAVAPLAIQEQSGMFNTAERLFKNTPLEAVFTNARGSKIPK